jgi:DNA-binding NtrC family response regulator
MQVRLLRVLQERKYEPLGSVTPVEADVRVIAATNRNLEELVRAGSFRDDLYYRVNVVKLSIPPLAQRREDIPLLVDHFVVKFNSSQGRSVPGVSEETMTRLVAHDYPGNVRELENIIEHAFVLCRDGVIEPRHLPAAMQGPMTPDGRPWPKGITLAAMEELLIVDMLRTHEGNRTAAARALGINPSTLHRKLKALRIELPPTDGRSRSRG